MTTFEPSLGQMAFGNAWSEFEMPRFARALFDGIIEEIRRVYWNREQREWEVHDDPKIDGVTYRPYWWGDENAPEVEMPNFVFDARPDVEIRWYKWPGRGMNCNVTMTADEWVAWFDACFAAIRAADKDD